LNIAIVTARTPCAALLAVLIAVGPHANAELLTGAGAPVPAQQLEAVERALTRSGRRQQDLSGEVRSLDDEATAISLRLIETAALIQSREALVAASEKKIASLRRDESALAMNFSERNDQLADLLSGVVLLERNPPPALVVTAGDALQAVRAAMLFGAAVPALRNEIDTLTHDLARLASLEAAIALETQGLHAHLTKLRSAELGLEELHDRKKELAATRGEDLKKEREAAASLAAKAKTLRQLVDALAEQAEKRQLEDQAAAEDAVRRARSPRIAFSTRRGKLAYPVLGEIVRRYGEADGLDGELKGMLIATRAAARVTSPADAKVEFAGSFRSYGQLLILDVGEGYHVLLAGLGRIEVETGQTVRGGEPVGISADAQAPGRMIGAGVEESKPVVYVELRKTGEAIDPAPWWIGGVKQARSEKGQN
jgi:septal ring factor EnvC (AmiA/AmiB activator)